MRKSGIKKSPNASSPVNKTICLGDFNSLKHTNPPVGLVRAEIGLDRGIKHRICHRKVSAFI